MDQQKQPTTSDVKSRTGMQTEQPQQGNLPQDRSIKQENPTGDNQEPETQDTQSHHNVLKSPRSNERDAPAGATHKYQDAFRGRSREEALKEKQEGFINWDHVESDWKQFKDKIQEKWGKLTNDELSAIEEEKDRLTRRLQEKYEAAKEKIEERLNELLRASQEDKKGGKYELGSN